MVTASYRSLRNWADTTGAKSFGRPIGGRSDSITASAPTANDSFRSGGVCVPSAPPPRHAR